MPRHADILAAETIGFSEPRSDTSGISRNTIFPRRFQYLADGTGGSLGCPGVPA